MLTLSGQHTKHLVLKTRPLTSVMENFNEGTGVQGSRLSRELIRTVNGLSSSASLTHPSFPASVRFIRINE